MKQYETGKQIMLFRKQKNLTQEELAQILEVSPQAISKWENGHSLPAAVLLPELAKVLDCTIDSILIPHSLCILEAVCTDGFKKIDVTNMVNKFVDSNKLSFLFSRGMMSLPNNDKLWFLTVKYKNGDNMGYVYCKLNEQLIIPSKLSYSDLPNKAVIVDAYYGNERYHYNAMNKIDHYSFFRWNNYVANYRLFPSNPATDDMEYLTLIYINNTGLHVVCCKESESIVYSDDKKNLIPKNSREQKSLKNIPILKFGNSMDCSWAGALTESLKYMGVDTSYEEVMGVSGACYRLAFHYPTWDYSSVDSHVSYDYLTPGYKAYGYKKELVGDIDKSNRKDERAKIIDNINNNKPVIAINLRVGHEWGIITGYTDSGARLLCRTYYDESILSGEGFGSDENKLDELRYELEKTDGYLYVDNWPFIILYFNKNGEMPSKKENAINSLRIFIDCVNKEKKGNYYIGYKAYEVWANSLINDLDEKKIKEDFIRYQSINHFCMLALVDARRCAYIYLRQVADEFEGDIKHKVIELSEIFLDIYNKAKEIFEKFSDGYNPPNKKWTIEIRSEQSEVLLKLRDSEKRAEQIARKIIENIE